MRRRKNSLRSFSLKLKYIWFKCRNGIHNHHIRNNENTKILNQKESGNIRKCRIIQTSPKVPGKSQHTRQRRASQNLSLGLQPPEGAEHISTVVKFQFQKEKKKRQCFWDLGSRSTWIMTLLSTYSKKKKKKRYLEDPRMSRRTNIV